MLELPAPVAIALNVLGIPALQLVLAWCFLRMPVKWFDGHQCVSTAPVPATFGRHMQRWKRFLPDGASWFAGGFPKRNLQARSVGYLRRFAAETRRAESCHWCFLVMSPVFFIWNPLWASAVISVYALVANLPCIVVQRFNRNRLLAAIARKERHRNKASARFEQS